MRSKHGRREKADPPRPPCENPDRAGNRPHNNTSRRDSRGAEARGRTGRALDTPPFFSRQQETTRIYQRIQNLDGEKLRFTAIGRAGHSRSLTASPRGMAKRVSMFK